LKNVIKYSLYPFNKVRNRKPSLRGSVPNKQELKDFHSRLFIVDMHADSLMWNRNLLERSPVGHVDIPRLIEGNVAVQVFSMVTEAPFSMVTGHHSVKRNLDMMKLLVMLQGWPVGTWKSPLKRAIFMADKFHLIASELPGKLFFIKTKADLNQYIQTKVKTPDITAGILSLEGMHALEGKPDNIQLLFDKGVRMMSPTHFFDNEIAGSFHGVKKGGLTELGQAAVIDMEALNISIDLAHCSEETINDILKLHKDGTLNNPVVYSHGGVRRILANGTLCNPVRNINDDHLLSIAETGGVVCIGYWKDAVCGTDIEATVDAIRHAVNIAGIDHVGLGSDYDGTIKAHFDTSHLDILTASLLKSGFNNSEIKKIMGENSLRVLQNTLP